MKHPVNLKVMPRCICSSAGNETGRLVTFEGGDGAGKSTLARSLVEGLQRRGIKAVLVDKKSADFGSPHLKERMSCLRKVLWDYPRDAHIGAWGDPHWFHLLVSWYSILDQCRIRPLLAEGSFVVVDNWYYKFAARFMLASGFDRQYILSSFAHLTEPDNIIFLDVPPELAVRRRKEFSATEMGRLDGSAGSSEDFVSYQKKVLAQLRTLCGRAWVRIDAARMSLDEIEIAVQDAVLMADSRHKQDIPIEISR